jgi:hypothetical protein
MGHVVSSSEVSGKIATSAHHGNQLGSFSLLKTRPALAFSHIPDADDSPPHSFHGRQRSQNLAAGPWQRLESLAGTWRCITRTHHRAVVPPAVKINWPAAAPKSSGRQGPT